MKIGVVCEGPTDFVAIRDFVGAALERRGISVTFLPLQPRPDCTDDGGWTRVIFWLEKNAPAVRMNSILGAGVFEDDLDSRICDALIIQMDSDILGEASFVNFMESKGLNALNPDEPLQRGSEIDRVLTHFARLTELNEADALKHALGPAVESTETWCVAAFCRLADDPELLKDAYLFQVFGRYLTKSEGSESVGPFGPPNKSVKRRRAFCERHRNSVYLEAQAFHFRQLVERVVVAVS
jgi:hypothetical protein